MGTKAASPLRRSCSRLLHLQISICFPRLHLIGRHLHHNSNHFDPLVLNNARLSAISIFESFTLKIRQTSWTKYIKSYRGFSVEEVYQCISRWTWRTSASPLGHNGSTSLRDIYILIQSLGFILSFVSDSRLEIIIMMTVTIFIGSTIAELRFPHVGPSDVQYSSNGMNVSALVLWLFWPQKFLRRSHSSTVRSKKETGVN